MDTWAWIVVGLIAWFAVAVGAALWLGPVLKSCSRKRDAQSGSWRNQSRSRDGFGYGSSSTRLI
jgi:hypothetical protein